MQFDPAALINQGALGLAFLLALIVYRVVTNKFFTGDVIQNQSRTATQYSAIMDAIARLVEAYEKKERACHTCAEDVAELAKDHREVKRVAEHAAMLRRALHDTSPGDRDGQ